MLFDVVVFPILSPFNSVMLGILYNTHANSMMMIRTRGGRWFNKSLARSSTKWSQSPKQKFGWRTSPRDFQVSGTSYRSTHIALEVENTESLVLPK